MERYHPDIHRCPFGLLCSASTIALLVFVLFLLMLG
jgi:hypothetical protein